MRGCRGGASSSTPAQVDAQPDARRDQARPGPAQRRQELLERYASHVREHHTWDLAPRCEFVTGDIAASNTVAWSYSSCRFNHAYGGVWG